MDVDYDVIVVGAGPGGSTAARFCARSGLKTLLVEKEKFPRYKPCGGCLSLKTVHLLDFDLTPVIENDIWGAKFSYCLKEPFFIELKEPIVFMVMRDRFDQFLKERALKEGAEILEGERVVNVQAKNRGMEIELASGERFHSHYLIGADGAESIVAKSISLPPDRDSSSDLGSGVSHKVIGDGFLFYRLNSQEVGFIINYDIKYRMGLGGEETEEEEN
ncbi:MAG: NAD(P)/FAD-dependent oxidoreductase [Deltaproteobacteria bacterium]|nr:NAD(P)/FAD-dependent oxidoreductase [Deltaproteobacteria bacterium]